MYYVYKVSRPSLLIESTDSMISWRHGCLHCELEEHEGLCQPSMEPSEQSCSPQDTGQCHMCGPTMNHTRELSLILQTHPLSMSHISACALTAGQGPQKPKSQSKDSHFFFFVKRCPLSQCRCLAHLLVSLSRTFIVLLSTKNVKPSQGKQIMPYILNKTFLAKSVSWNPRNHPMTA